MDIIQRHPAIFEYIPSLFPVNTGDRPIISSPFGYRTDPLTGSDKQHKGIDIMANYACYVYASATGKVLYAGEQNGYGKCVIIDHKYGFQTLYAHLSEWYCYTGKTVQKGQIIGFLGDSGRTTGNHLHFEIRKNNHFENPLPYFQRLTN
jgi:murein DD-endopeptidase MepM/ murein hydrolase activator NlpD